MEIISRRPVSVSWPLRLRAAVQVTGSLSQPVLRLSLWMGMRLRFWAHLVLCVVSYLWLSVALSGEGGGVLPKVDVGAGRQPTSSCC